MTLFEINNLLLKLKRKGWGYSLIKIATFTRIFKKSAVTVAAVINQEVVIVPNVLFAYGSKDPLWTSAHLMTKSFKFS